MTLVESEMRLLLGDVFMVRTNHTVFAPIINITSKPQDSTMEFEKMNF